MNQDIMTANHQYSDAMIHVPDAVAFIIDTLEAAGYEAYAVGGCVRDSLLGRIPMDWDITTSAVPVEVKKLFHKTFDTGIEHGTITVLINHIGYEVTTYRIDGEYEDDRHPKEVAYTKNLREDLRRRDFTINAMAYHPVRGMVDLFGGCEDLKTGIIRCVGDAKERFGEDALRMMRAVRFSAQLGFDIEDQTKEAIKVLHTNLNHISAERIHTELNKLLLSDHPDYMQVLYETGITAVILPEFDRMMATPQNHPYHVMNVGQHTMAVMKAIEPNRYLRWAALLHDVSKPPCRSTDEYGVDHFYEHCEQGEILSKSIMRRLKMDNDTINIVSRLVRWHDYRCKAEPKAIRRAINRIGEDIFDMELQLMDADAKGKNPERMPQMLAAIGDARQVYQQIMEQHNCCVSLKQLAINGRGLMELGMKPGPNIKTVLQQLLSEVIDEPEKNDSLYLQQRAQELIDALTESNN